MPFQKLLKHALWILAVLMELGSPGIRAAEYMSAFSMYHSLDTTSGELNRNLPTAPIIQVFLSKKQLHVSLLIPKSA